MMSAFHAFSPVHVVSVLVLAAVVSALAIVGRAHRGTTFGRGLELGLAFALAALWTAYQVYDALRFGFNVRYSLPLQLCDLAALLAAAALVRPQRTLHAITYFWGCALSTQAVITPDLAGGPSTLDFWAFWSYHAFVVGSAVYIVFVRQFRPTGRDLSLSIAWGVAYAITMFAIDAAFDLNYGYFGRGQPTQPSLLDFLGPYPLRCLFMVVLAAAAMSLFWLPWALPSRREAPR